MTVSLPPAYKTCGKYGKITNMQTSFLAVLVLVTLAVVLLSVRVIVKKNGRFSSQHLSQSAAMRERGIGCVQSEDRKERQKSAKKLNVKEL